MVYDLYSKQDRFSFCIDVISPRDDIYTKRKYIKKNSTENTRCEFPAHVFFFLAGLAQAFPGGVRRKLDAAQLAQLRRRGTFDVASLHHSDIVHVWKVSALLVVGTENIVDTWRDAAAMAADLVNSGLLKQFYFSNSFFVKKYHYEKKKTIIDTRQFVSISLASVLR